MNNREQIIVVRDVDSQAVVIYLIMSITLDEIRKGPEVGPEVFPVVVADAPVVEVPMKLGGHDSILSSLLQIQVNETFSTASVSNDRSSSFSQLQERK